MIKAALSFSVMALCVKAASQGLPSLEVVFFRSLIGTIMIAIIMKAKKISFAGGNYKHLMVTRGVTGFIALALHFYTIAHLPLGTAVMLNYTSPIFAAILAFIFLKERPHPAVWMLTLVSFFGLYLLVGGRVDSWNLMVWLGVLSAAFTGIVFVTIRAMRHHEDPLTIIFYFTSISTVGSLAFLPFGFEWPNLVEWLILLGVGIGSFYGQLWMTIALRKAPASLVTPFSYLTPLMSFIYGFLFFGDQMQIIALLGAGLILLAGILLSLVGTRKIESEPF